MRNVAEFTLRFFAVLMAGALISSCNGSDDCDPRKKPLLTEKEQAVIPNQPGDTLHFLENAGQKYFLVCRNKDLTPVTYIPAGHENTPCQSIYETWDKLTARFEGNLVNDHNALLSLEARIEGGENPNDPEIARPCKSDYKCSFYLIFNDDQPLTLEQIYLGKTDESLVPVLVNFNSIPQITLGGQQFQKLNAASISDNCASPKPFSMGSFNPSPLGLDSVYYSAQHGLIRLTTTAGKKYQRVL